MMKNENRSTVYNYRYISFQKYRFIEKKSQHIKKCIYIEVKQIAVF